MRHGSRYLACLITLAFVSGPLNTPALAASALVALPQPEAVRQLRAHDFAALEATYSSLQRDYRNGKITDEQLRAAFQVFEQTSAGTEVHYDAWVAASANSYVAQLARGIYYRRLGYDRRGGSFISETSAAQVQGMREAHDEAAKSLFASFDLDPKPILSYLYAMDLSTSARQDDQSRRLLDLSLRVQPDNFVVRDMYMRQLRTKWSGSTQAMIAFYEESKKAGLSSEHLRKFEGLILEDRGWVAEYREKDYKAAVQAYAAAEKLGVEACLRCMGRRLQARGQFDEALSAFADALRIHPDDVKTLENRSGIYLARGERVPYIADLKAAAARHSSFAMVNLGVWYMKGIPGVLPQDRAAGEALFHEVIKQDPNSKEAFDAHVNLAVAQSEDTQHVEMPVIQTDARAR